MPTTRGPVWVPALTALLVAAPAAPADQPTTLRPADFDKLRAMIRPAAGEAAWARVDWVPARDIWAARRKAAAEGKPLFLWYMAGEPLGSC